MTSFRRIRLFDVCAFIFVGFLASNCAGEGDFSEKSRSSNSKSPEKSKTKPHYVNDDESQDYEDEPQIIGTEIPLENEDDENSEVVHEQAQIKPGISSINSGDGTAKEAANDPDAKLQVNAPVGDTDLNQWCQKAHEVQMMNLASGLRALLSEFCNGGEAKPLLKSTLIASAHQGGDQVNLTILRALASNRSTNTTSIRVGYALKLPVDAKDYFDRVSATAFDEAKIKEAVEGPGGTATVRVLQRFEKDGLHHVRGVLNNQILQKSVQGRTVYVESDTRSDQFMFEDGLSYMYTGTVVRAVRSMKNTDTLAALVRVAGISYMVVLVDVTVPNRGYPGIAEPELKRSTQAGTNALYKRIIKYSAH